MMSIISSETLWATNIKYLNDEHEFQHALDLINNIIPNTNFTPENADYKKYLKYIESINKKIENFDDYKSESVFTISFTTETDLLSQWRGYCSENNGFCIEYNIDEVFEEAKKSYGEVHLLECVYGEKEKESQLKALLNKHWFKYSAANSEGDKKSVIDELSIDLMLLASHFKHPSFSEECEKRVVVVLEYAPDNDLKFREGQFSIVPYIELPAPRKLISKIIIGPTSNKKLSARSLEMLLERKFGVPTWMGGPDVEISNTPYRTW